MRRQQMPPARSLGGRFRHPVQEGLRQADRVARMRDARLQARGHAGSTGAPGTFVGSVNAYGRWGVSAWGDMRWRGTT